MKKILLVTRPIAPPWDEASKNFAYFLSRNIFSVEINLMTKGINPDLPENVRQHPIYSASEIAGFNLSQKLRSLFFQLRSKGKFDLSHYFFTPTKLNSFLIKHFLSSKKTKTIQTVATLREDLWSDEDMKKLLFADLIITYSEYAKRKLESLGFQNVRRVYPGIDLEEYRKKPKNEKLLVQKNLAISDFVINFTGEYTRLGAMDLVIDSFIEISQKISVARLSLAVRVKNEKDARKKEKVIEKLKHHNLLEKVSFFDDGRYRMSEVYNLCDISLFPVNDMRGKFDIPLAVVEAMATEKPVIISDLPILSELGNDKNSVIIEKGNLKQLTEAIFDLYENPEKRASIGQNARAFVEEKFDIKKVAEEYKKIYQSL
jgi:glycosyltransferase involved in cell wall biosynthesis